MFRVRYGRVGPLLVALGLGPRHAGVELTARVLRVRMGWAFRADIPRPVVRGPERDRDWPWAIGVHTNLSGSWLVNGSATGIVSMDIDPPARARVAGFRVKVRRLGISLEDPDGFLAALRTEVPS